LCQSGWRDRCRALTSGEVAGGHAYDEIELELPERGLAVDLDHDGQRRGEVVYGEVAKDGRINVVAVLDEGDWLDQVEEPVYFSPELTMIGGSVGNGKTSYIARIAELRSLALTLDPLGLGARPVSWRSGDARRRPDRSGWAGIWREPLLHRAVEHGLETRSRRLVDLRAQADDWHGLKPGDVAPTDWGSRRLPNGLLRSAHVGRIIRVTR
jgi:hypothetical protein